MSKTWRDIARPIIARVLEDNKYQLDIVVRIALKKAYPFGERSRHPYKIWCDEIKVQMKTEPSKQYKDPYQKSLF